MEIKYKNDLSLNWSQNGKYPHCYMGAATLGIYVKPVFIKYATVIRIRWMGRYTENDWQSVDTARRINFSPRWAKWLEFISYYAGMRRNMYHFGIGKFRVSILPQTHGGPWYL